MKKATVEVVGIRPLFFNAFRIEAISNLSKVRTGSAGNDPEEWKRTVLEKNNQLYIPGSYWTSCLKNGSFYTKAGRGSIQKSFVSSTCILTEISLINRHLPNNWEKMTIEEMVRDSNQPVYLDIRGVTNPSSKSKNIRYRIACCPGWKTEFQFTFDDTIISASQIKKIVDDSGKNIGIGDGRLLGYGRFQVEKIEFSDIN